MYLPIIALGLLIRRHLRHRRTPQPPKDPSKVQAKDSYPNYYHGSQVGNYYDIVLLGKIYINFLSQTYIIP